MKNIDETQTILTLYKRQLADAMEAKLVFESKLMVLTHELEVLKNENEALNKKLDDLTVADKAIASDK